MTRLEKTKALLEQLSAGPKKSLGQNFLISDVVITRIIEAAKECAADFNKNPLKKSDEPVHFVEVGPGLGALTESLIPLGPLTLIELDKVFSQYWRDQQINLIEEDALAVNWSELTDNKPTVLVSNLPYQISSSIVIERSIGPLNVFAMILMFQKEVAQRIKALPMTEDYGLLTVIAQTYWKISKLIDAGPREFFPPPNIVSRVLTFEQKTVSHQNRKAFLKLVKAAFSQRRKLMVSNLKSHLSPEQIKLVLQWLGENKKSEQIRAEELSPAEFEKLYLYLGIDSL